MKYFKTAFACILLCWAMPIALVALMNGSLERDYMNPDELIHGLNLESILHWQYRVLLLHFHYSYGLFQELKNQKLRKNIERSYRKN